MSGEYRVLSYDGATPGANTDPHVLFDSERAAGDNIIGRSQQFQAYRRYLLSLNNSAPGVIKAYGRQGNDPFKQFFSRAVGAASAQGNNEITIPIAPHVQLRVEFVNGGQAQSTWLVAHALDDGVQQLRPTFVDPTGAPDPGVSSSVTTTQLPATLGQKPLAQSISVGEASDSKIVKAASLKGYTRGDGLPISVTNASKCFAVPAAWIGKHVRLQADGGDLYYQISNSATLAEVSIAARASETGSGPIVLGAEAGGNAGKGCGKIPRDTFLDVPFEATAQTFALIGSAADMCCRAHPAET